MEKKPPPGSESSRRRQSTSVWEKTGGGGGGEKPPGGGEGGGGGGGGGASTPKSLNRGGPGALPRQYDPAPSPPPCAAGLRASCGRPCELPYQAYGDPADGPLMPIGC